MPDIVVDMLFSADDVVDSRPCVLPSCWLAVVSALTTANQQLGSTQGLLSTTSSALNSMSTTMSGMRDVLVNLASSNVTGTQRTQYQQQYASMLSNVNSFIPVSYT